MPEPSALCVCEAVGMAGRTDTPGHLYFFRKPGFTEDVPPHQEAARQQFEEVNFVLRISLQKDDPDRFAEFFSRVLTMAQATFEPIGFNPSVVSDLPRLKQEVVQVVAASIKAAYTAKLLKAVTVASAVVILISYGSHWISCQSTGQVTAEPTFSLLNTGCLLAASFWGLLFASMMRSIEPTFETLVTPDADLMQPWVRLTFYGIAVIALALLFQSELVTIAIGDKVSTAQIKDNLLVAVMLGLFLGVAERALPKEVQYWSKRFLPSSQNAGA